MHHRTWTIAAAVMAAAVASCDQNDEPRLIAEADAPQEVAETYCEQMFSCSCEAGAAIRSSPSASRAHNR